MRSTSPSTQTIHEEVQQLPPHSTSLASQAVCENLQQLPLDSTTRTSQTIQEQFEDSINHETNEQLEEQGPSSEKKRKRGKTQMSGVHGRKERKQVVLNETNQPIGHTDEVVKELGSFLGTLARNATFCPLNVFNWRKLETKEDMWKYVKEKYDIPEVAEVWGFKSIQNAWRKYKNKLMKEYFEAYENDELRMEKRPIDVPESQFRELINIGTLIPTRNCPKPKTNMKNHRKLRYPHTAGITSFALIREAEMERVQSTQESEYGSQSVDAFASVMGPEHPGRLRLYGRGVTKTVLKRKMGDFGPFLSSTDEMMQQKWKKWKK